MVESMGRLVKKHLVLFVTIADSELERFIETDTAEPLPLPDDDRPVLVLTEQQHETEWTRLSADYRGHIAVVAHPARLSADPSLKRPAWESLKRLGAALHAG